MCCIENVIYHQRHTFYTAEEFNSWYEKNKQAKFVTHNGISFDIPVINRIWKSGIPLRNVIDTLVLSFLYNPKLPKPIGYKGSKGPHSLDTWGFRLGDYKIQFDDWSELTDQMVEYCIQDTSLTVKLYTALTKKMLDLEYSEQSAYIEHGFRWIIDVQQNNGFKFDRLRANFFYLMLREKEYNLTRQIQTYFPSELIVDKEYNYRETKEGFPYASYIRHQTNSPKIVFNKNRTKYRTFKWQEFNIGSPSQRVNRLLGLGWKPSSFTPKGNPKIDEESILEFAEKSKIPQVKFIAEWLVLNGRANMVRTWLNNMDRSDDTIKGKVFSCGAGSRRCTHSSPNTANIPGVEAEYGRVSRSLWTARPKRVLVGADASGLEGRVFIHYLNSKEAEEFMLNDPHTSNAEAITRAVGFTVERRPTKNLFYARLYGATDRKLGSMLGKNAKTGELVRTAIDQNIPGFESLVDDIQDEFGENGGRIQTVDGGFVTCPSPHAALNYKFQSCGAIIMKLGAIRATELLMKEKLDALKVGDIHDEWQYDVDPSHASRVGEILCEAMTIAGEELNMNIKIEGEYSVGKTWAETH